MECGWSVPLAFQKASGCTQPRWSPGGGAFSLEVSSSGQVSARRFPAPEPELMWNQKYGHRARPRLSAIQETLAPADAETLLRQTLSQGENLSVGKPTAYYGYVLFPLCGEGRQVGEAAVSSVDGRLVQALFPEPPASAWVAPGVGEGPCP